MGWQGRFVTMGSLMLWSGMTHVQMYGRIFPTLGGILSSPRELFFFEFYVVASSFPEWVYGRAVIDLCWCCGGHNINERKETQIVHSFAGISQETEKWSQKVDV